MRVGLFTDTFYPKTNGVATSVLMLKEHLEANGHVVYVFTTTDSDAPESERNVYRIPSVPFKKQRLGIFVSPALLRLVGRLSLDIIHTHTEFTLGNLGRIMARRLGVPVVHTMHTIYEYYTGYILRLDRFEHFARAMTRRLTAIYCNSADTVIVPSVKTEALIRNYGVLKDIRVIPTGIPLDRFDERHFDPAKAAVIRSELGITENNRVILNIGRVSQEKNLDELLVSLRDYIMRSPDVVLLIVGDGPARKELERLSVELGIRRQVIFAGSKPWDEIHLYYRLGDVFVGASESETQGLTYIEAMASGLPVVAKDDRCLDDILVDGGNGFSFSDAGSLNSAVERLLVDAELLGSFAESAAVSARRFSAEAYAGSVAGVYAELVSESRSSIA